MSGGKMDGAKVNQSRPTHCDIGRPMSLHYAYGLGYKPTTIDVIKNLATERCPDTVLLAKKC